MTKRIKSPKVKTHPIMEIVAKSMFGLNNCDCVYYQKMVNRCAKKVLEYHTTHLHQEVIRGKIEELSKLLNPDDYYNSSGDYIVGEFEKRIADLTAELEGDNMGTV